GQATKVELKVGMPEFDKLGTAWAEDRATQGCDLSADPSADRSGAVLTVAPGWPCWPESDKSQGFGGRAPIWKKGHLPFEKTLTNGADPLVCAGPPGPALRNGNQSHANGKAGQGAVYGPGVRPTIFADRPVMGKTSARTSILNQCP